MHNYNASGIELISCNSSAFVLFGPSSEKPNPVVTHFEKIAHFKFFL